MSHATADRRLLLAPENVSLPAGRAGASIGLMVAGVAAILATAAGGVMGGEEAGRAAALAYLVGFCTVAAITLGSLAFVMALHQTGAVWSAAIRRVFENAMSLAPVLLLLFLPLAALPLLGRGELVWKWMDAEYVAGDLLYDLKRPFLNQTFFFVRQAFYFVVWIGLATFLVRNSLAQDTDGDKSRTLRMRKWSAPGLLLLALTAAFASFDWMMALDFHFFSTMFGVFFFANGLLAALAFGTLTLIRLRSSGRLVGVFNVEHLHDLSKLVFGFTVFWAYISFSQYFLIWYANIPEETAWVMARRQGPWLWIATALAVGKFIVPFIFLLPRPNRRRPWFMAIACVWVLAFVALDMFWTIRPELVKKTPELGLGMSWLDFVGPLGPILIFLGAYARATASRPLVPMRDPRLDRSLAHKNTI